MSHTIHHVTAVTAQIRENLAFYTETLGLRLVKKSVNQDDVSAYHLFYADAAGTPGTDMTFFDWPTIGPNVPGAGSIAATSFRVPKKSLDWWQERLEEAATGPMRDIDELECDRIQFSDPEGQRLELVEDDDLAGEAVPWDASVPGEFAIRGILGVDLESARPRLTWQVLTDLLGFTPIPGIPGCLQAAGPNSFARIRVAGAPSGRMTRVGAGGVHHVAFRVKDDEELREMQAKIEAAGLATSGYVDRFYFHSLYFREPGGILFELATDGPGFASDEDLSSLGEHLALPPFLEARRSEIESGLQPLS